MDPNDERCLERAKKWLRESHNYGAIDLPKLLVEFENYLLTCEAERQARG